MTDLIINICIAISIILIWVDAPPFKWFREKLGMDEMPEELLKPTDYICYLINCGFCLAFWTGLVLTILTGGLFYLTLPLLIRIIESKLL